MKSFQINITPAANGDFTVWVTDNHTGRCQEFTGSMPEVGDYIKIVTTQG